MSPQCIYLIRGQFVGVNKPYRDITAPRVSTSVLFITLLFVGGRGVSASCTHVYAVLQAVASLDPALAQTFIQHSTQMLTRFLLHYSKTLILDYLNFEEQR